MDYGKNLKLTHLIAPGMEICNGCLKSSSKNFWNSDDLDSLSFWAPDFLLFVIFHWIISYGTVLGFRALTQSSLYIPVLSFENHVASVFVH